MEWLKEGIIASMFAVLSAWHWYDKSLRDTRFRGIEQRIVDIENTAHAQQTQLQVMNTELKAFSTLTDVRLEHIQNNIEKILNRLERGYSNE
tara:strand:+ start:1221 stop:1496 length:276 start_codon:yes stop_codon:yes gene_type:complete